MESNLKAPVVSVRLTSYQHAKFIGQTIESVLKQTFQDFEIEITDDCSTDNSVEVISSFHDPRIHLVIADHNRGVAATATETLRRCKGKYTACLCSDDIWLPDKLEKQVNFLESHPNYDAVLTGVEIINDEGHLSDDAVFNHLFSTTNRSKEEWLRQFFFYGNSLCMPSAMLRTDVYKDLDGQNPTLSGLSDFDLWIRFCMNHELYILSEKLTQFRLHAGTANESGLNLENQLRGFLEDQFARRHFTETNDVQFFSKVFPEFQNYGSLTHESIPYFLSRISLDSTNEQLKLFGYNTLWEFMQSKQNRVLLEKEYGFYTSDLHSYSKQIDPFHISMTNALYSENYRLTDQLTQMKAKVDERTQEVDVWRKIPGTSIRKLTIPIRKTFLALKRLLSNYE